ncbi:hypothetical protein Acr_12g0005050 [Actinidia rufa]|uniref:Uncharacterized protein n=1 Tax=Actinidia rufa TaxID=165716 RepID=A0A7J0FGY9_9ERIC|nr:hypothetical protein Acr_12g0005050 [Actinidia rufa]
MPCSQSYNSTPMLASLGTVGGHWGWGVQFNQDEDEGFYGRNSRVSVSQLMKLRSPPPLRSEDVNATTSWGRSCQTTPSRQVPVARRHETDSIHELTPLYIRELPQPLYQNYLAQRLRIIFATAILSHPPVISSIHTPSNLPLFSAS